MNLKINVQIKIYIRKLHHNVIQGVQMYVIYKISLKRLSIERSLLVCV